MRYLRIVLTLVFGLAMVGPETHACPVHSATPAHHQGHQQSKSHCTCPQACCPTTVCVAHPSAASRWTATPKQLLVLDPDLLQSIVLPSRKHLLPFAQAPPLT